MTDARRPRSSDLRDAPAASDRRSPVTGQPRLSDAKFFGPDIPRSEAHDTAALWEFAEEASLGIDDFAPEDSAVPHSISPQSPSPHVRGEAPIGLAAVAGAVQRLAPLVQPRTLARAVMPLAAIAIVIALATTLRLTIDRDLPARPITIAPATTPDIRSQAVTSTLAVPRTEAAPTSARIAVTAPTPTIRPPVRADNLAAETQVAAPPALPVPAPVAPPVVIEPALPVARAESPATAAAPSAPVAESIQAERDIRLLLDAYRQSYDRLDVVSTAMLWPGVDTAALSRAFGTIASQQVEFDQCALDVLGERATARCNGSLHYVRRVGSSTPQSRSLSWAFELNRSTGKWLISRVSAQ
jgi:hypothetical protein